MTHELLVVNFWTCYHLFVKHLIRYFLLVLLGVMIGYFALASEKPADPAKNFKQDMKEAGKDLKNAAGDLRDKAKEDIKKVKEKADKKIKKTKGKTKKTIKEKIGDFWEKMGNTWKKVKEKTAEGWSSFRKAIGLDS